MRSGEFWSVETMARCCGSIAIACLSVLVHTTVRAQTSYPMTLRVEPVAVTRGQAAEIAIAGQENFSGAFALLCQQPGLRGEVLKVEAALPPQTKARPKGRRRGTTQVRARIEVSPIAPLGPRELRVATPQGVSSVGQVVVVDDPVVPEVDDLANDKPDGAQKLTFPSVISGRISKIEDVDWYAFTAVKGQIVAFEVWGNRLENKIHDLQMHLDPLLALHDALGRELVTADNNRYADPCLFYEIPSSGTYYLQVRDTTYGGDASWCYALHAVSGPVATSVFPMAINPGTTGALEVRGPAYASGQKVGLSVAKGIEPGVRLFALPAGSGGSLPIPLLVSTHPVIAETSDVAASGAPGQAVRFPAALAGRLAERGDVDGYRFEARQGLTYVFEVVARRAGSECDPVVRLLDGKGATLVEADDTRELGKDVRIEWKAPADGTFVVQISDLHDRGGDGFGYVLLSEAATPDFTVTCDPDKINVGPGGRVPIFVRVERRQGFSGPVQFSWRDLPPGISASALSIAPELTEGVMVVSAARDAKPSAALVTLKASGNGPQGPIARHAQAIEEIYVPGGGRGRHAVDTLALGVTEPSDITVEVLKREIVLAPGESAAVDVAVARNPRYDKPVNLDVVLQHLGRIYGNPLPRGVTVKAAGSKTLLGPTETKGRIVLQAAPNAPACERVPIVVMGHVSINFVVKTAYASAPILVSLRARGK
jgi:hypothetical protein